MLQNDHGEVAVLLHRGNTSTCGGAADVLAYFGRTHTSNGPTGAVNGRLEHRRGPEVRFRNPINIVAPALLEAGGFGPELRPEL